MKRSSNLLQAIQRFNKKRNFGNLQFVLKELHLALLETDKHTSKHKILKYYFFAIMFVDFKIVNHYKILQNCGLLQSDVNRVSY